MPASGTRTILVVENESDMTELYRFTLEMGGYNVIVAKDGFRALEQARLAKPDLILMRVGLPGMDGVEVCRRLKNDADTNGIPVILASATASAYARQVALLAGAQDYLVKPFAPDKLLDMIASALKRRRDV